MRILIVGAGEVGTHLARILSREEHEVTVLDRSAERLARLREGVDVRTVEGDGADPSALARAEASACDLLVAVTDDDRVNLLAAAFGKHLGGRRAVVRVHESGALREHRALYRRALGVDAALSLEDLAAEEVLRLVRDVRAVGVESFAGGRVQARRIKVTAEASWTGRPMRSLRLPRRVLVTAIVRGEEVLVPGGDDAIQPGDQVLLLGEPARLDAFERRVGGDAHPARRIVILAATPIGLAVARALEDQPRMSVKLIEEDPSRAAAVAEKLRGTVLLRGDGTDVNLLREEGIGEADAFVAVGIDDARNLVSSQLAKSLGARKTIALVHKPDYALIYDLLGIDAVVAPRLLCANQILRFARGGAISSVAVIAEGKAEVLELEVARGSAADGRSLAHLGMPRGAIVGAVVRDGEAWTPTGKDELRAGDVVVVFTLVSVIEEVEALFESPERER